MSDPRDMSAADLQDVLLRNGFVPCDIAACNCGSWHARFGLRERFEELKQDLSDAGHPLTNENGNLASNALRDLITERDALHHALRGLLAQTSNIEVLGEWEAEDRNYRLRKEVRAKVDAAIEAARAALAMSVQGASK